MKKDTCTTTHGENCSEQLELDFYPVPLINHALPYAPTEKTTWTRTNGAGSLTITAVPFTDSDGNTRTVLPSGKLARLALLWLSTEAKKNRSTRVDLAVSYRRFIADLGLNWNHQTAHDAVEQLRAILAMVLTYRAEEKLEDNATAYGSFTIPVGRKTYFVFDDSAGFDDTRSHLLLSDDFYQLIIRSHVAPIDSTVWARLVLDTRSPMALDVYLWLCARMERVKAPTRISWEQLYAQFGSEISELYDFKKQFRKALTKALEYYPQARVKEAGAGRGKTNGFKGLILSPSPLAVPPKEPDKLTSPPPKPSHTSANGGVGEHGEN